MSNFAYNNNSVQKSVIKSSKFPFIFPVCRSSLPFEKVKQARHRNVFFREAQHFHIRHETDRDDLQA